MNPLTWGVYTVHLWKQWIAGDNTEHKTQVGLPQTRQQQALGSTPRYAPHAWRAICHTCWSVHIYIAHTLDARPPHKHTATKSFTHTHAPVLGEVQEEQLVVGQTRLGEHGGVVGAVDQILVRGPRQADATWERQGNIHTTHK